jgi:hypothetical protein
MMDEVVTIRDLASMIVSETRTATKAGACATCHWLAAYMPNNPSHGGECVRHAPSVVVVHDTAVTIRPTVRATDRCGEWTEMHKEN